MPGEIDDPVSLPEIRSRSSTRLGLESPTPQSPRVYEQLIFNWPAKRSITRPHAEQSPVPTPPAPVPKTKPPSPALPRQTLSVRVERLLRERKVPYVSVDEAKRALFNDSKLRAFHFVVYRPEGPNWLVWAAQMRKEARQDLLEWEKIFGEGFLAVAASEGPDQLLRFRKLTGEPLELS